MRRFAEIVFIPVAVALFAASSRAAEGTKPAASAPIDVNAPAGPKLPAAPVDEAKMPDVVASVNGTSIKKTDLQNAVEMVKAQLQMTGQTFPSDKKDEMYRDLLDELIGTELLAQEAKTRQIEVKAKEIDDLYSQFKDRFPSEQVFQNALKEQGITEDKLREEIRQQIRIKKLLDKEVAGKVNVDDKAAKAFYEANPEKFAQPETVHAAHVLILVDKTADEKTKLAKRKEADQVLADARAGKDFGQLAKDHSGDPGTKDKGGDLGPFGRGDMVPAFENAAFALKNPGDLSEVVETPYGFHVIKLIEKTPGRNVPFDEVKKDISDFLKDQKSRDAAKAYVATLRKKATVKVNI